MKNKTTSRRYRYILTQLSSAGWTLKLVAASIGCSASHLQRVLTGDRVSETVQTQLHQTLGCDVLAPEFFDAKMQVTRKPQHSPQFVAGTRTTRGGTNA